MRKKYGPKTPEEKQRCEASRQTDVPQQLFELYQQESDQSKRIEYLKKAAEMGFTPAQAELGDCYAQGRGVERDYAKASEWYCRAAGQPPQQTEAPQQTETPQQLFELYQQESDQAKRIEYLKKAAQQGYAPARRRLEELEAQMPDQLFQRYQREPDQAKRMEYLKKSAEMGYTPAQAELGDCYAQGRGVERDYAKASEWYCRAAGQPPQQTEAPQQTETPQQLFELYQQESDQAKRMEYLKKAAQQGYAPAQTELGDCYRQNNNALAVDWYCKAVEQSYAPAQYQLGKCYYYGWRVEKDKSKAVELYQKAADQGHKDAQRALADCYENGRGVKTDKAQARYWREKAKNNNG